MRILCCALLLAAPMSGTAQLPPGTISAPAPALPAAAPAGSSAPAAPGVARPAPGNGAGQLAHSISFEVKVGRAGASTDMRQGGGVTGGVVTQATTTTSRQRDKRSQLALDIVLRNFANRPDQAKVDWTFFCERVDKNSYRVGADAKAADSLLILSQGAQDLAFKPGGTEKVVAESAAAIMHESRSSSVSNVRSGGLNQTVVSNGVVKTGYKIVGWFTRVTADGQLLGIKASSPRFETMARNEAALAALPRVSEQAQTWAPPPSK